MRTTTRRGIGAGTFWIVLGLVSDVVLAAGLFEGPAIRVGTTASLSGRYAESGLEQLQGIQMWVDDVNGRGALLGRKVELIHYDDRSDPNTSAQLYEKLISEDEVDLLLGPYASDLNLAASEVTERHQFPMVATGGSAEQIWARGFRNIFGTETPTAGYAHLLLEYASGQGLERIALIYEDSAFPREMAQGAREDAAALGMTIVFDEAFSDANPRFDVTVTRMRSADPELVIGGTYLDDSITLTRELKRQGFTPEILAYTVGPALRGFGDSLGADAERVMGIVQWMPSARLPLARDFSYRYQQKYGRAAGPNAGSGYASGQVTEAAVRLAGTLERSKIREQLRTLKFRSILGHYRVDDTGMQIAKPGYVMQWQGGQRHLILPEGIAERRAAYPFQN